MSKHGQARRFPARVDYLATIRAFVEFHASALGMAGRALDQLVLAADECITNVIEHGYETGLGELEVEVLRRDNLIYVFLRDRAAPFDPTQVEAPDFSLPLEERPIGGLGVYLARELTDLMHYERRPGGINELMLAKQI